ncbi:acyltransferase family protein [Undibacterium sp.]|uniref:acyltransferase family protein n=1 Tax=Undibacterium sp. TaxID=1914977 RepID=UPI002CC89A5C|nr:acyltransferase family protein [Undibacterium sp.]HTD02703.1 acyltransferase family protein [Undibacterium sp.]
MTKRRHDIDALRALAFGLLILYHLAMVYVQDWGFHIKSSYQAAWLQWPMLFVNRWRMDLIFLISGMSTAMLLQKLQARRASGLQGNFFLQRTSRLMLPLLFGMAVVVPLQPYCQGVANGLVEPGFGQFIVHYYGGYHWPALAFDGWQYGFTWNHLWYLLYLWLYTAVLLLGRQLARLPAFGEIAGRWRAAFLGLRGWRLLVFPAAIMYLWIATLQSSFPESHALANDWYAHAAYFTMFIFGWWMGGDSGIWTELARLRKPLAAGALMLFAIYFTGVRLLAGEPPVWQLLTIWAVRALYAWCMLCAVLGWGHTLLNRPFRWLSWSNQAVYPWYVLHQSLIILFAYWLIPLRLGGALEATLVGAGTVAGCWILTSGVIARVGWLRVCFGMKNLDRPASALPAQLKV